MPFRSEAQRRFMYAKHPRIAKRWEKHTPKGADLPEHVKKAMLGPFIKIGIYLKKLKPVPAAIVQQREVQMAMAEAAKGKSAIADRAARRVKST